MSIKMDEDASNRTDHSNQKWKLFNAHVPRSEIVFFVQVLLVYIVVITSIVNLTIGNKDPKLWIALLSGHIGYLLPNPTLRKKE